MADGFARAARLDRHTLALDGMATERPGNCDAVATDETAYDREVNLAHRAILELSRERHARKRRARDDHYPGGFLVETMYDSRTHHAVRFGHRSQFGKASDERVDQRRMGMAGSGMDRH